MDYKEVINKIKPELDKVVSFFEGELAKIRVGRATPSLVENLEIPLFGQKLPLKQLGAISCPEPRQIIIRPWDKSYIEPIEKAILQSNVGLSPVVDKEVIRISLPPMTEDFRKELLKLLSQKKEEARSIIRKWRDQSWKEVQDLTREGEIREDDKFRAKDELQKLVDEYNGKIEELAERKRKEIES